jgi:hypothetical protein
VPETVRAPPFQPEENLRIWRRQPPGWVSGAPKAVIEKSGYLSTYFDSRGTFKLLRDIPTPMKDNASTPDIIYTYIYI